MLDEDRERTDAYAGPFDLPDDHDGPDDDSDGPSHSLTDDLLALVDDGKTYAEAEIAFQKSRGAYAADRAKGVVLFGLGAFGVFHLALIAATVGAVIALVPLVGPWAATGIVATVLIVAGAILLRLLKRRIDQIIAAFSEDRR